MPMLGFDFGNRDLKWAWMDDITVRYGMDRHAIVKLTDAQWRQAAQRATPPRGFIRVNNEPFVVGEAARRYLIKQRPAGAERYRKDYYSIALAYAMSEAWQRDNSITLFATHAPRDVDYAEDLQRAAAGTYVVETRHGTFTYNVSPTTVYTLDEPISGLLHWGYNVNGQERANALLGERTLLVVDIGGHTVDTAIIEPGGNIDPLSLNSTLAGFLRVTSEFEAELRANNRLMFKEQRELDENRVYAALLNGKFPFGNQLIDCADEAERAIMTLVNDTVQVIAQAGGAGNYDRIILTGGGSAVLHSYLQRVIPYAAFELAENDRQLTRYANAFGAFKYGVLLNLASKKRGRHA